MDQHPETDQQAHPSRRTMMSVGAVGLASMAGLTACGGSGAATGPAALPMTGGVLGDQGATPGATGQGLVAGQAGSAQKNAQAGQGANDKPAADGATLPLNSVPKGGFTTTTMSDGKPVIVAQTKAGKVVAYSATCTHQGCQVVAEGKKLGCPCHGAEFDPLTGKALKGPAKKPLSRVNVTVEGDTITVA